MAPGMDIFPCVLLTSASDKAREEFTALLKRVGPRTLPYYKPPLNNVTDPAVSIKEIEAGHRPAADEC